MFDWDLNALEMYHKELRKPKQQSYLKQMMKKNLYSSELFKNATEDNSSNSNGKRDSKTKRYYAHSDIFNVKTESDEVNTKRKGNSIKRINKNAETVFTDGNIQESKRIRGRIATQLQASKDNPFYC